MSKINYYRNCEGEIHSFLSIPRLFFTLDIFHKLSNDSKILYGLLYEAMQYSDMVDSEQRIYMEITLEEVENSLNVSEERAVEVLEELEESNLIECGDGDVIYLKNFATIKTEVNPPIPLKRTPTLEEFYALLEENEKSRGVLLSPIIKGGAI
ncbi:MAG: replication initiator protein A [Eubacteriales bacterium]